MSKRCGRRPSGVLWILAIAACAATPAGCASAAGDTQESCIDAMPGAPCSADGFTCTWGSCDGGYYTNTCEGGHWVEEAKDTFGDCGSTGTDSTDSCMSASPFSLCSTEGFTCTWGSCADGYYTNTCLDGYWIQDVEDTFGNCGETFASCAASVPGTQRVNEGFSCSIGSCDAGAYEDRCRDGSWTRDPVIIVAPPCDAMADAGAEPEPDADAGDALTARDATDARGGGD